MGDNQKELLAQLLPTLRDFNLLAPFKVMLQLVLSVATSKLHTSPRKSENWAPDCPRKS